MINFYNGLRFIEKVLFLLSWALLLPESIWAKEEKNEEVITLGEVTVTATKMEKKVKDVPAPIYVITEEDIKQTDARNIEEVLQRVPGVFTQDKYHAEYNVVTFRGVSLHTHVTRGIPKKNVSKHP